MDDIHGIQIIGDMSKAELIDELLAHQRKVLEASDIAEIKMHVIDMRLHTYRKRLEKEAAIQVQRSIFGVQVNETDED